MVQLVLTGCDCAERYQSEFGGSPRIRAGVELGDPHLHPQAAAELERCGFELIVGSVRSLRRRPEAGDGDVS
jgi:hypothetical protein